MCEGGLPGASAAGEATTPAFTNHATMQPHPPITRPPEEAAEPRDRRGEEEGRHTPTDVDTNPPLRRSRSFLETLAMNTLRRVPSRNGSSPHRKGFLNHAHSKEGLEWEGWLSDVQNEVSFLRGIDADKLFCTEDLRERVAAHILKLKRQLDHSYQKGVRNLHDEIQDLAERSCFHFSFFSWAYMSRLGFSLALVFICAYICALASMCSGYRTPHVILLDLDLNPIHGAHTLPDVGHDLWAWLLKRVGHTHDYVNNYHIPDLIVGWTATFTQLFILVHPRRFLIMRRIAIVLAILFLFRAFTVTVTSLPDASPTCVAQFTSPTGAYKRESMFPTVFYRAFKFVLRPTHYVTCGDMVFSGHTTVLTMCAMVFRKYCRGKKLQTKVFFRSFHISEGTCMVLRWIMYLIAGIGALLIIGTRLHYTLDVAIAIYITQRTFRYYHHCVKYPALGRKFFLARMLCWLEAEDVIAVDDLAYNLAKEKQ